MAPPRLPPELARATILDVPYFSQSELLCGGAAAAMVLRYWGFAGVRPDDFASLVSETRGGMAADDLAGEIEGFGWSAFPFAASIDEVRRHLSLGRPVISLIEAGPGRFHYVVIVGTTDDRLVLHDPAGRPYEVVDASTLIDRWTPTGGLSLLLLPPRGHPLNARAQAPGRSSADVAPASLPPESCRPAYDRAMAAARQERLEESRRLLRETECPDHPAVLRELAGVTLRLGDAGAAIDLARRAARRDPDDAHVARTLATALYVADRPEEALAEWNRADEPVVDLVRIGGLDRVRYGPAARAIGLSGGQLLTPRGLAMARRRLDDLPASATTRVSYAPTGGGRADIVAGVAERRGFVLDPFTLGILGTRALIYREVGATAVSPLGAGETWTGTWRWWRHRPGVAFRFATPSEFGPRSTWTVAAAWERETYALEPVAGTPDAPAEDDRAGGHLEVGGWIDPAVRIAGRIGYDRWETAGGRVRLGGTTEVRAAGDRLRLSVDGDVWVGGDGPAFRVAGARADATTNTAPNGLVGRARGYVRSAAREAPLTLWPGAGGGVARPDLLRAHRLLDGGILAGDVFDRHLAGGGIEIVRWFSIGPGARLGPAAFVDLARAWGSRTAASRADAGAGLRLTGPGGGAELRLDVAFGLSDDEWAISAGWSSPR